MLSKLKAGQASAPEAGVSSEPDIGLDEEMAGLTPDQVIYNQQCQLSLLQQQNSAILDINRELKEECSILRTVGKQLLVNNEKSSALNEGQKTSGAVTSKKRKKAKKIKISDDDGATSFQDDDQMEEGSVDDHVLDNVLDDLNKPVSKNNVNVINKVEIEKNVSARNVNVKIKPPPLVVYSINGKDFSVILSSLIGDRFAMKTINKNLIKIYTYDLGDFQKVKELLDSQSANYYTFTPKSLVPHNLILFGLDNTFDFNDLKSFLANTGLQLDLLGAKQIQLNKSIPSSKAWVLKFSNASDVALLLKTSKLGPCIIRFEIKHKPRRILQCSNCQRFGHASFNCKMQFRCLKCNLKHSRGECQIIRAEVPTNYLVGIDGDAIPNNIPICSNCRQAGHPANFKGCPKYVELVQKIQNRKDKALEKHKLYQRKVEEGVTFSQVARNTAVSSPEGRVFDNLNDECVKLFGKNLYVAICRMKLFIPSYAACKTEEEKRIHFLNLIFDLSS